MRITLNGDLGSGKSTIGNRLAQVLGIPYVSTGRIFREIGQISNLSALQTNLAAEDNTAIDFAVDKKIKELDQNRQDFILDSRMAWHFVHGAVNVFLSVELETAALRIMSDHTRATEQYPSLKVAIDSLQRRRSSENKRYRSLYGVDIDDINNYDLAIITDDASVDEIVLLISEFAQKRFSHKFWIPKCRLVPMISIRDAGGITFATRLRPADSFHLQLCVKRNFGFYFGGARDLVNAFHYAIELVPYVVEIPQYLACSDVFELAKQTLQPSDIYDWEELSGLNLAFAQHLKSRASKVQ